MGSKAPIFNYDIDDTPQKVVAADPQTSCVVIANHGDEDAYIVTTLEDTAGSGFPIPTRRSIAFENVTDDFILVCDDSATTTVAVLVLKGGGKLIPLDSNEKPEVAP